MSANNSDKQTLIEQLKAQPAVGVPPKQHPWADYVVGLSERQLKMLIDDPALRETFAMLSDDADKNKGLSTTEIFKVAQTV